MAYGLVHGLTEAMILRFCEARQRKLLISNWLGEAPQFHGQNQKKIKATQDL
jgi:hypothetical protein